MQADTLAPVSHRQLQPLRDYLCWAPVAVGRSQQEEGDALKREVTASPAFAFKGLVSIIREGEDFGEIINVWRVTEGVISMGSF